MLVRTEDSFKFIRLIKLITNLQVTSFESFSQKKLNITYYKQNVDTNVNNFAGFIISNMITNFEYWRTLLRVNYKQWPCALLWYGLSTIRSKLNALWERRITLTTFFSFFFFFSPWGKCAEMQLTCRTNNIT